MTKIKFTATIDPLPQPRPRFAKGHAYNGDRATAHYRYEVKKAAVIAMAGAEPFNGAIACTLKFYRRFNPTAQLTATIRRLPVALSKSSPTKKIRASKLKFQPRRDNKSQFGLSTSTVKGLIL